MHTQVDTFLSKAKQWKEEMTLLRSMLLACGLEEDYKWMHPCYTLNGNNVVLIHGFKEYCALLFFKGVSLKDEQGILIQQTANVQDRRQLRFTHTQEIKQLKKTIQAYIKEAMEIEASGRKVAFKKTEAFAMPEEFEQALANSKKLRTAFEQLTPGRQRAYLLHFAGAKQAATRTARIEKYIPQILDGKGLHDA
jgi:uncharacterized protein YdeI (YjbR/CyaY-like superfamily)